jgi:purine-nucleoside phosphorylase
MDPRLSYDNVAKFAEFIKARTRYQDIKVGIVCGSGFGDVAHNIREPDFIAYEEIPGFPVSTVSGHKGCFVIGILEDKCVVCMQGRVHPYEGYGFGVAALPIRVMKLLGVDTVLLTNAAGGFNPDFKVGDFMIIKDQVFLPGFAGMSPLFGPNDERFGPRFPPMSDIYDRKLRQLAKEVAAEQGINEYLRTGVYAQVGGPQYETPAELQLLRILKADVVGMSTCHEAIVARHCGLRVFGLSLITNYGIMDVDGDVVTSHEEVLQVGKERTPMASKLLLGVLRKM